MKTKTDGLHLIPSNADGLWQAAEKARVRHREEGAGRRGDPDTC
jgi:hypothetical protein